jgi:hypothetical protein
MAESINGIQLGAKLGQSAELLYGNMPGSDIGTGIQTLRSDMYANNRIAFEDSQTNNIAHQTPKAADVNTKNNITPQSEKQIMNFLQGLDGYNRTMI